MLTLYTNTTLKKKWKNNQEKMEPKKDKKGTFQNDR